MRVISGKFKGRKILYNNLQNVRPTTDRTKESLFNILNQYFVFEEISALDLFLVAIVWETNFTHHVAVHLKSI